MATSASKQHVERGATAAVRRAGWARVLLAGALAGLLAGLTMTTLMGTLRLWLGLPTPAEMIGDTVIPGLDLDTFFALIGRFDGGNGIKQVGISSVLVGQVVVGTAVGALYGALVAGDARVRLGRFGAWPRATIFLIVAGVAAWLGTIGALRGVLHTNYRGLPAAPATALTIVGLAFLYGVYALVLFTAARQTRPATPAGAGGGPLLSRRAFIVGGVTLVAAAATGWLLRSLHSLSTLLYDGTRYRGPEVRAVTPNDQFYSVTKNILDPDIARAVWRLRIDGRVARPRTYTYDELAASPARTEQEATVSCISNDVGDGLASNAVWTGVPLRALLAEAGIAGDFVKVVIHGADNYTDTLLPDKALEPTTFVAWGMNGEPLPQRHGYPVRLVVPGRFGEKSVKWVTRIEVVDRDVKGFYERQGWGPTFTTPTYSRFDAPVGGQGLAVGATTRLHGIAFSGDRGITRVEVSTDDGQTWTAAGFNYQKSPIVWTLWSLDWRPPGPGEYRLAVRAVDGTGAYQTSDTRGIAPDGATGYHRITVRVG